MSVRSKAGIAAAAAVLLAGASTAVTFWRTGGTDRPAGALSPLAVPGRGAQVAFAEQEAETGETTGTVLAHDRGGTLQAQASGRSAVTLDDTGEYVEFTLPRDADALTFRYSIPEPGDDRGRDAAIDVGSATR